MSDQILFVGHSCLVVTLDGQSVLVDANFSNKLCGLVRRRQVMTVDPSTLKGVSALAVTSAHYGHLDFPSYKFFSQETSLVTPLGLTPLIRSYLTNPVVELKSWMSHSVGPVTVHAVPTQHYGFRLSGLRYNHCNGYVIQGSRQTIYLAGDTGYGPHFEEIGKRFKIDVACLPIGAYEPAWLMKHRHLNPEEALRALDDLKARVMIPIHWGAFHLSLEPLDEPLSRLKKAMPPTGDARVKILMPGEVLGLG